MAQKLSPSKTVNIFTDPLTEQKSEGFAKLIKQLSSTHYSENTYLENWIVIFESDNFKCQRMILALQD